MIRHSLKVKPQGTEKIDVFPKGTDDFKNLRYETLYIADYKYVNISSFLSSAIISWSFISQTLKVAGPLGGKFDFSVSQDLKFKATLITKSQKSSYTLSEL